MSSEAPGVSVGPTVGTPPGSAQWEELGAPAAPSCPHRKHRLSHPTRTKLRTQLPVSQVKFLEQKYLLNLLSKRQAGERIKRKKKRKAFFLVIKSELFSTH